MNIIFLDLIPDDLKAMRELFPQFKVIEINADHPFTYGFRYLTFWILRVVQKVPGRLMRSHLIVRGVR